MSWSKITRKFSKSFTENKLFYGKLNNNKLSNLSGQYWKKYIEFITITTQNIFFTLRKINNRNKLNNNVIVAQVELSLQLDSLVLYERSIFFQC